MEMLEYWSELSWSSVNMPTSLAAPTLTRSRKDKRYSSVIHGMMLRSCRQPYTRLQLTIFLRTFFSNARYSSGLMAASSRAYS